MRFFYLLMFVFFCSQCYGQEKDVALKVSDLTMNQILDTISTAYKCKIYYKEADLQNRKYTISLTRSTWFDDVNRLMASNNFKMLEYGGNYCMVPLEPLEKNNKISDEITRNQILSVTEGETINLSGVKDNTSRNILKATLIDAETNDEIIGAIVSLNGKSKAVSDENGKFELVLSNVENIVSIEYVGYKNTNQKIILSGISTHVIRMEKDVQLLKEVTVSSVAYVAPNEETQSGVSRIDIATLDKIPTFLGERDVVKAVLLNPGVSSVGESASGYNVRGGNVDQNLIIQDDAILFNSSHALGFFSTLNADMIQTAVLHKGAFNAQYGGRLASVLDVQTKEGADKFNLKGNINLLSTSATAEIPLFKGVSLLMSGRTTYSNYIFQLFKQPEIKNSSAGFYDLNAKLTIKKGKSTFAVSGYVSDDDFIYNKEFGFDYSTKIAQASLRTLFNNNFSNKFSIVASEYISNQTDFVSQRSSVFTTKIKYLKGHNKVTWNKDNFSFDSGIMSTFYNVSPGASAPIGSESLIVEESLELEKGLESALYASSEYKINKIFDILCGVRLNHFASLGPKTIYNFENDVLDPELITGTEVLEGVIRSYINPEFRLSAKANITKRLAFKTGYGRTTQFLSQIFNTDVPTPSSQWQMVNHVFEPGIADNFSAGFFYSGKDGVYEFSAEAYLRKLKNVYDYIDYAELFVNPHIETEILTGEGDSKGLEFSLKKNKGVINGFISYTYSQTKYRIDGINNGKPYFANYDQPHNISLILNYQPIEKITLTSNFTFRSGRPTTAPISSYENFDLVLIPIYSERNALRIPNTHRLDLSANFGKTHNKAAKFKSSWTFTIYNVYGRKNPFSVFYGRSRQDIQIPQANRLAIIGTVFPSLSFNAEFE